MTWCAASSKASLLGALVLGVSGCGASATAAHAPESGEASPQGQQAGPVPPATPGSDEPARAGVPDRGAAPGSGAPPGTPPPDLGEAQALPKVVVRNIGLHIGGGPNDPDTKLPFQKAIELRFEDLLRCYRLVEQPEKGGTFGVDLYVAREGGSPSVRQPRTAMGGSEFQKCVVLAFERVSFERPKLGPTVISYSIRFELE